MPFSFYDLQEVQSLEKYIEGDESSQIGDN
jgi:hypothetical protein